MKGDVRLGLVGCGRIAERGYAPAFQAARGVTLAAVADPDDARCRRVAPGLPRYESAEAMAAEASVDGVVLATPAALHLPDARLLAEADIPALVEKPPAADAASAEMLARLEPMPCVGFNRRFDPALRRVRAAARAHPPFDVHLELRSPRDLWQPYEVADDALLDLGPHLIDLARWLTGCEIRRVRSAVVTERQASLQLELDGGTATVDCKIDGRHREVFEVRHAAGRARHVHGGRIPAAMARLRGEAGDALVRSLTLQLTAFGDVIRGSATNSLPRADEGVPVMRTIEAARRSAAAHGRWELVS